MKASNKVVFNTVITYSRVILTSFITLYSIKLILSALGAEDFGLYNVVGGMVAMLAFLNAAMTTATQRFISINLGKGEIEKVKIVFANSIIIHFFIGLILVIGIDFVGVYLINNHLKIPPDKITVAIYILHFVVASTFVTVISVPFDAVINANENFLFLAIVHIINSLLNLAIAFSIFLFSDDKLFYYGLLTMVSAIFIAIIKRTYSKKKYKECNVNILKAYDYNEMRDIGAFAGWSLFGSLCYLARNQGVAVVLNLFYTTVVNAAYGIAHQVNSQIMFFSQTMMSVMKPQIMKSEGANDRERMIRLSLTANKFSFYLFTFFAIPLFFEIPFILKLWLNNVPEYTIEFCRSIILLTMMNQINMGLMTAIQAIGQIKVYQIVAGGIQLLTLPIGFIFLKLGYPPYSIILVSFILESISTLFRIFYFEYLTGYSAYKYFKNVLLNSFFCLVPVILVVYCVQNQFSSNWLNLILVFGCSMLTYILSIYFIGIGDNEKDMFNQLVKTLKNKILKI